MPNFEGLAELAMFGFVMFFTVFLPGFVGGLMFLAWRICNGTWNEQLFWDTAIATLILVIAGFIYEWARRIGHD